MNNVGRLEKVQYGLIVQGRNTREDFPAEYLGELADSIREHGVLEPLILHRDNSVYRIIGGECRWRAAGMAGLTELPAIVHEGLSETEILALTIVENLQRQNLNPMEEARGFAALLELHGGETAAAKAIGKPIAYVQNRLALLRLPEELQTLVRTGELAAGAGTALAALPDQLQMARLVKTSLNAARPWRVEDYRYAVERIIHANDQLEMFTLEAEVVARQRVQKNNVNGQVTLWSVEELAQELGITKPGAMKWVRKCPKTINDTPVLFQVGRNGNSTLALREEAVEWILRKRNGGNAG